MTRWSIAAAAALLACVEAGPVVQTKSGPVQGIVDPIANVNIFHSIPYAAPPIGSLRFAAPQPPAAWTEVLDVTAFPPPCAQTKTNATSFDGSEDCLYIQVYAPTNVTGPLPVLHWIYGGGYVIGDSSNVQYIGTDLAAKTGSIVVTHNYRLGPFGFLALPALRAADANGSTGNQGLQDQTLALQWVHDNIAAFGGDPSRVTIFGESAGGFSVCWHMVSQASAGLFASAIMESGTCDAPQFFTPVASAMDFGALYSAAMGCNGTTSEETLDCMRAKSTADVLATIWDVFNPNWPFSGDVSAAVMNAGVDVGKTTPAAFAAQQLGLPMTLRQLPALAPIMPWGPAIDGSRAGLLDLPLRLIEQGNFNRVPMVLGTNANEMTVFLPLFPLAVANTTFPPGPTDLGRMIEHGLDMFPAPVVANLTSYVTAFYPVGTDGSDFMRTADALTHMFFTCSARRAARSLSQYVPTYLYQFSYALDWLGGLEYWLLGDFHTAELEFVWRDAWPRGSNNFTAADWAVADAFSGYWGNMAHTGSPNGGPLPVPIAWPQYSHASDVNLQIQMPFNTTAHLDKSLCDAWDVVYASLNTVHRVR